LSPFPPARRGVAPAPSPKIVDTALGPIECAICGEGEEVLVALHGGMGGYDQSLLLASCLLADPAGRRIVAMSRPGYLGTPLDVGRSPERQADAAAALLDALGVSRAVVAAVSAGGPSALQFAARHPDRCRALALISACSGRLDVPPGLAFRLGVMRLIGRAPFAAAILSRRGRATPERAARRSISDDALRARTLRHPEAGPGMRALQASVFDRLGERIAGTANDIAMFSRLDPFDFGRISAPIFLAHGSADRIVPFDHAKRVAERAPDAELLAIERGEHMALFTHLDEVRAAFGRFLRTREAGSPKLRR
jgi:pimeloyl-ACP methyl ester carboxylesterase